jgi:hypothetical protein
MTRSNVSKAKRSSSHKKQAGQLVVLVHGTADSLAAWYRPGGALYEFIQQEVFPNASFLSLKWSGGIGDREFKDGAAKLIRAVRRVRHASQVWVICHSNGANVANFSTHPNIVPGDPGLDLYSIAYLAPHARRRSLPSVSKITSGKIFVFRPELIDEVLDSGRPKPKNYTGTALESLQVERFTGRFGHWSPTYPYFWEQGDFARLVNEA